jgi:hypothetical protein
LSGTQVIKGESVGCDKAATYAFSLSLPHNVLPWRAFAVKLKKEAIQKENGTRMTQIHPIRVIRVPFIDF